MDIPVDLQTTAVDRMATFPMFQTFVLEGLIGTDAADSASDSVKLANAWLLQGLDDEGRPFRDPEGSGTGVVVLSARRDWAGANRHNTAKFPMLQMLIYMDSSRDENGGPVVRDAFRKLEFVAHELDRAFHLVGNEIEEQLWPNFRVHSSVRQSGFEIRDVPNTQSLTQRAEMTYEIITD